MTCIVKECMKVEVSKQPKSIVELTITIPYGDIERDLKKAAKDLSEGTNVAGFRPGKAPLEVIQKKLGEAKVLEAAVQHIVPRTLAEAIDKEELEYVGRPDIVVKQLVPEQDVIYTAKVSVLPEVSLPDLEKVSVTINEVKVDEKKVDSMIEDLRKMRAGETAVTREAKNGDKVLLDMDVKLAGVSVEGGKQHGAMIWLGNDSMIPGFTEKIEGKKIDDSFEFTLPFPPEYHVKHLAGKEGEFHITVKNIFEVTLPEVNDEFAAGLGKFKTVDEMKDQLRSNLLSEAENEEEHRVERKLIKELIKQSTIGELPENLVEHELEQAYAELRSGIEQRGLAFDEWAKNIGKSEEELKKELTPQAEERVQASLLTRKIAMTENIIIDDSDIEEEINAAIAHYGETDEIKERIRSQEFRDVARRQVENRKVMSWLKDKCVKGGKKEEKKKEDDKKDDTKADDKS